MKKGKFKVPDVFVIVFVIIVLSAAATWFLPGGQFERKTVEENGSKREVIVENSFKYQKSKPQYFAIFEAPLRGFVKMADIIGFVFFVGGAFFVFQKTGAINAAIAALVKRMNGGGKLIIIFVMFVFSFFGAFFGMCEEAIPFVLIFVPLALALGYDSITGLCFSFLAAGVGFATAFFNPFTVQIAQKFSEIPPISGWEYRVGIWVFMTAFTIFWVLRYAEKVKKNPKLSLTYESDQKRRAQLTKEIKEIGDFNNRHAMVLLTLALGIAGLFFGVIVLEWYITELAALFIAMGIIGGLIGGLSANDVAKGFIEGAKDIASAALIIGFAGGVIIILTDGNIMDTLLNGMSNMIGKSYPLISSYVMYGFQMLLNFFIPSGTTKAALTMPLFAPLADLTGITRQTAVLAYQFGDGFTNMIIPTSGVTVGTLGLAKVPFEKWFKWLLPLQIIFIIASLLLLIPPVIIGWTGT
ncbi:MAG: putative basic amino acid antiporter YfcC [bacterium]|nr:putative basic amino acid antiporter YfcC [bacterium]